MPNVLVPKGDWEAEVAVVVPKTLVVFVAGVAKPNDVGLEKAALPPNAPGAAEADVANAVFAEIRYLILNRVFITNTSNQIKLTNQLDL